MEPMGRDASLGFAVDPSWGVLNMIMLVSLYVVN